MEILGGPLFSVAAAGESHGPGVVTIVFGCPPGLFIERARIQSYLDRRRPGSSKHGTPRREGDRVILMAGLYQPDETALTGGPDKVMAALEAWRAEGASHISLNTMGAGLRTPAEHLAAIREFADNVGER